MTALRSLERTMKRLTKQSKLAGFMKLRKHGVMQAKELEQEKH